MFPFFAQRLTTPTNFVNYFQVWYLLKVVVTRLLCKEIHHNFWFIEMYWKLPDTESSWNRPDSHIGDSVWNLIRVTQSWPKWSVLTTTRRLDNGIFIKLTRWTNLNLAVMLFPLFDFDLHLLVPVSWILSQWLSEGWLVGSYSHTSEGIFLLSGDVKLLSYVIYSC